MKKFAMILLVFALVGCGGNSGTTETDETTATSVSETTTITITASETTAAAADEPKPWTEPWAALYYEELVEHIGEHLYGFGLYDLDADGAPELLITESGAHVEGCGIYTVYEGEIKWLGYYGSYGTIGYNPDKKYIYSHFTGQGYCDEAVYRLENGEMTLLIEFEGAQSQWEEWYKIDGVEITKDEYDAKQDEYFYNDGVHYVYGETLYGEYEITQSEIERVLKEVQ